MLIKSSLAALICDDMLKSSNEEIAAIGRKIFSCLLELSKSNDKECLFSLDQIDSVFEVCRANLSSNIRKENVRLYTFINTKLFGQLLISLLKNQFN